MSIFVHCCPYKLIKNAEKTFQKLKIVKTTEKLTLLFINIVF